MRALFLRERIRARTTTIFLVGLLIITSVQVLTTYHKRTHVFRHSPSNRTTSDIVLLTSLPPAIAAWSTSSEPLEKTAQPAQEQYSVPASESNFTITQLQRSLHIVYRLSRFNGSGRGASRISHLLVSLIGILGMFSAIVGALIGPWLADTNDESAAEDRFSYWVHEEEDEEDDETICGFAREEKYGVHRISDVP